MRIIFHRVCFFLCVMATNVLELATTLKIFRSQGATGKKLILRPAYCWCIAFFFYRKSLYPKMLMAVSLFLNCRHKKITWLVVTHALIMSVCNNSYSHTLNATRKMQQHFITQELPEHRYVIKNDNHDCSLFPHCSLNHLLLL